MFLRGATAADAATADGTTAGLITAGASPAGCASAGVVMVGGSGPSDRHNDTYFPPIRRHLVDAGLAVLSYDKRGVGGSSGEWRDATLDDLAADAVAALDFLRAQPGVRPEAVGLFGHSEGGWVVLRAATTARDGPSWVITNSCPGVTPAAQERHALSRALRERRRARPDVDIDGSLALFDRLVEVGRRDADFAEAARLVESAGRAAWLGDYWAGVDERLWEFLKRKQDHDPLSDTPRLRCPHLAVFGGADPLVPVAESIHRFATAACGPGRHPRATLTTEVFPDADHRIHTAIGTRPAPGHLTGLTRWIGGHTVGRPLP
ncbi:alpha/beta hydrolase family protein [Streptomyces rishiriensis]|uniref:alpha/beta hydrolase family protein n=1 Tax=Streptomyces rishiriensis TaxID=68264 RepID=UPI0027D7C673|nr:alpha/beta hydrolase [Streptomyces rishiriensis]